MKTPKQVDVSITNRCNLRCSYCYHFSSSGDVAADLSGEEWNTFFEELNKNAVMTIGVEGGEPFIRKDLREILEGIVRNRMRFFILSNGTLITDEMASYIASTGRCDYVQVSVDGSAPKTHDVFRGEGNFAKAMEGIQTLKRHKIPVTVRVTIHQKNVNDLEEVCHLLLKDLNIPNISTNDASHMGLCRRHVDDVQLNVEERSMAMAVLYELNKKYKGRIQASAGPLAEAVSWMAMEKARKEGLKEMPGKGFLKACGGVLQKMAVRADGIMVPCIMLSHIELGRINKDDLFDVWQNHPEIIRLRTRQNIPLKDFEFCAGCDYTEFCTGNCPALTYNVLGKENHPSPASCFKRFLEKGGRLPHGV